MRLTGRHVATVAITLLLGCPGALRGQGNRPESTRGTLRPFFGFAGTFMQTAGVEGDLRLSPGVALVGAMQHWATEYQCANGSVWEPSLQCRPDGWSFGSGVRLFDVHVRSWRPFVQAEFGLHRYDGGESDVAPFFGVRAGLEWRFRTSPIFELGLKYQRVLSYDKEGHFGALRRIRRVKPADFMALQLALGFPIT